MSSEIPEQHPEPESQSDPSVAPDSADASSTQATTSAEEAATAADSPTGTIDSSAVSPVPTTTDSSSVFDNPPQSPLPEGYYTADGTPTFDAVRDRIEQRIATADGRGVLDEDVPQERDFRREQEDLKRAGEERLKQLRKSMGLDT